MNRTKDERYLLTLYEMALETGDLKTVFDRFEVGEKIGFSPKLVRTLLVGLMQANFIRKENDVDISLMEGGIALAEEIRGRGKS